MLTIDSVEKEYFGDSISMVIAAPVPPVVQQIVAERCCWHTWENSQRSGWSFNCSVHDDTGKGQSGFVNCRPPEESVTQRERARPTQILETKGL